MEDPANPNIPAAEPGTQSPAKKFALAITLVALVAILIAIDLVLGRRVLYFAGGFAALWFAISFVLLSRPPAVPEFQSERATGQKRLILRRDILPIVPIAERLHLSLTVACGACLLLWITLGGLGR